MVVLNSIQSPLPGILSYELHVNEYPIYPNILSYLCDLWFVGYIHQFQHDKYLLLNYFSRHANRYCSRRNILGHNTTSSYYTIISYVNIL